MEIFVIDYNEVLNMWGFADETTEVRFFLRLDMCKNACDSAKAEYLKQESE